MGADIRLVFSPVSTYRDLLATDHAPGWHILRRFLLIALVIGTSASLAATASVDARLVLTTSFWWSFAPLIQIVAAAVLVLSMRERPVSLARGVELMIAGHAPWSLWLLAVAAAVAAGASGGLLLITAGLALLAVLIVRYVLVYHFCRTVLTCTRTAALLRATLHQAAIAALIITYVCWAIAFVARVA